MKLKSLIRIAAFIFLTVPFLAPVSYAKSAREIDASVDTALERFQREVFDGGKMVSKAKGVLVFPSVIKAGIGLGGEYGTGALRINGKTVEVRPETSKLSTKELAEFADRVMAWAATELGIILPTRDDAQEAR